MKVYEVTEQEFEEWETFQGEVGSLIVVRHVDGTKSLWDVIAPGVFVTRK